MTSALERRFTTVAMVLLGIAPFSACREPTMATTGPVSSAALASAKAGTSTVTVTAANPSFGHQGQVNEAVTITGSGFGPGAQASWQRNGVTDTTISVISTQVVSSTQLVSTVSISPNAPIAYYDIAVTVPRTKGIGSDAGIGGQLFEVTQAVPIAGASLMRGVNDNGEITGNGGPVYWSAASGVLQVDAAQSAGFDISPLGNAIAANGPPRLYTRAGAVGTSWSLTMLPVDAGLADGGAKSLAADPVTGQVTLIGGVVKFSGPKHTSLTEPRLWVWQPGTASWKMVILSTSSNQQGYVRQVSWSGITVGSLGALGGSGYPGSVNQAAVWTPDGSGGWTLTTLAPMNSGAEGINRVGTLIVGASGGVAAYWEPLPGGGWSAPIILPGGCADARAVDDAGRIVLDGCSSNNTSPAAALVPPYSAATMLHLGGLGKGNTAEVESMSPSGNWVVGWAGGQGVYWRPF